jgi:hypothetical protein
MPLIPAMMQGAIIVKATSQLMSGQNFPALVSAISTATCQYLKLAGNVVSTNTATGPGAGTQIGRIYGLTPGGMTAMMTMKAITSGIVGKDAIKMFSAVSTGVVVALNAAVVQGNVIGASLGVGQGKVVGLMPAALQALLLAQTTIRALVGTNMIKLIDCIAFGICTHIMTVGTVILNDIGAFSVPPGPLPLIVPGFGRIV